MAFLELMAAAQTIITFGQTNSTIVGAPSQDAKSKAAITTKVYGARRTAIIIRFTTTPRFGIGLGLDLMKMAMCSKTASLQARPSIPGKGLAEET